MEFKSIYVHIPFCIKRCNYCDFVSNTVNKDDRYYKKYSEYLVKELMLYGKQDEPIKSIYFGGGTPTVLPVCDLIMILAEIKNLYTFEKDIEITVEANPGTVDLEYLQALKDAGVNRLSLGGQSFIDKELEAMGRIHKAGDIKLAVELARTAGFNNLGVDLIYALPDQTLADFQYNLETAIALNTEHISLYSLQIDNNSYWGKMAQSGGITEIDDDLAADMLKLAIDILKQAGFDHYEIANFAKPGFESRHNGGYWQRENYLGVGVAAASCNDTHRWINTCDIKDYFNKLTKGIKPIVDEEYLTDTQVVGEAVFLGLRQKCGVDIASIKEKYSVDIEERYKYELEELLDSGLIEKSKDAYKLTERGLFLGNQVFIKFV